jgi:glycosyltransferase involved in cell wall biosynthesis
MDAFFPTISIIVPVYNGETTIGACLESLLQQNYPEKAYEIIVVENGSTDRTTEVVEKYPVRLFHSAERGPAAARNLGISKSDANIVAFTDADCIADPEWLSNLVRPYEDPQTGGVGGIILAYRHAEQTIVEQFSDRHSPLDNFISGKHEFLPHLYTANASYRRTLLQQIGGFNPRLMTAEDVDVAWRLQAETGSHLAYAPTATIHHHHRSTLTGLKRQYRHYGFGEILLDTMYGKWTGYPRGRLFQTLKITRQFMALGVYALSTIIRQGKYMFGKATPYEVMEPRLWFLIESSNILGKLEAIVTTRGMTDARRVMNLEVDKLIPRLYGEGNHAPSKQATSTNTQSEISNS